MENNKGFPRRTFFVIVCQGNFATVDEHYY